MFDLLERFNAIASCHAIPEGISRVEGYRILFAFEEGTEDGPRVVWFICLGYYRVDLSVQRIIMFFQFIGHVGN
jgi:hypothetical protein